MSGKRIVVGVWIALVAVSLLEAWRYYRPTDVCVTAAAETVPVTHGGDAADDVAIWVNPADPERSLVIGTDKEGGLHVYDLTGAEVQSFENGEQNNVDLRAGVPFGDQQTAIVVTSASRTDKIFVYRVDADALRLERLVASTVVPGVSPEGICLGRNPGTGELYCFVNGHDLATGEPGIVEQHAMRYDPSADRFASDLVRRFDVGGEVEGCVADDELGFFFVSEESVAVWRYGLAPDAGETRIAIDSVGLTGRLRYNAEGIAIHATANGNGSIVVSSQGSDDFTVYDRVPPHAYRGRFCIARGEFDDVSHTDGIEVASEPLGPRFPDGLFVAQDDKNDSGNQNFKLVNWRDIVSVLTAGP